MRYRATIAYDGTAYYGFQRQANTGMTIQAMVEAALGRLAGKAVGVVGAGRTDRGVHASGQVIAFDLEWRHTAMDLCRALNANLPADIAVREVCEAAPVFHPRFDALSRTYAYRLYVAPVRDPLRQRWAWHVAPELDVGAIKEAVAKLPGEHDFKVFGRPLRGESPVRTVYEARWEARCEDEQRFTIKANAFLYRMVRRLVGALVSIGQGRMTVEEFGEMLAGSELKAPVILAPPHGLTLIKVDYDGAEGT